MADTAVIEGTGVIAAENTSAAIAGPDLMDYLPDYYRGVREMEALQGSNSEEIGLAWLALEEERDQLNVETAVRLLDRWERELGLQVDPSKSKVGRREVIKAKLRGAGTTTPEMIRRTASAFSGGEVAVEEITGEYAFEVRFVGTLGVPPRMNELMELIEEIKPAHLDCRYQYTYTWWDALKAMTWSVAHAKTWDDLRVYE